MKIKRFFLLSCAALLIISLLPAVGVNAEPGTGERVSALEGGQRDFLWPVPANSKLASSFVDGGNVLYIDGAENDAVIASYDGTVEEFFSECSCGTDLDCSCGGRGNYVLLRHEYMLGDGKTVVLQSRYSHLSVVLVDEEVLKVEAGAEIGKVGSTGIKYDVLTFEILYDGVSVDPFINELLKMPDGFAATENGSGREYVEAVREFYTQCKHSYDDKGECTQCQQEYDCDSTSRYKDMGVYRVLDRAYAVTKPYSTYETTGIPLEEGTLVDVIAVVKNAAGESWGKCVLEDGTECYIRMGALDSEEFEFFASQLSGSLSSIQNGQEILQGRYQLRGAVWSGKYPLKKLVGYFDGDTSKSAVWNAAEESEVFSIELYYTELNSDLKFGDLELGEHTLTIVATDTADHEQVVVSCTFRVVGETTEPVPEPQLIGITFVMDPENQLITLEPGQALGQLPEPEAAEGENVRFKGWWTAPEGGEQVTAETVPTEDMMLYPQWEPVEEVPSVNQYIVTLDPAGGTVSPSQITVTYGGTYEALPRPTREGYTFMGWKLGNKSITDTVQVQIAEDHTLVAVWREDTPFYVWAFPVAGLTLVAAAVVWHFYTNWKKERSKWST